MHLFLSWKRLSIFRGPELWGLFPWFHLFLLCFSIVKGRRQSVIYTQYVASVSCQYQCPMLRYQRYEWGWVSHWLHYSHNEVSEGCLLFPWALFIKQGFSELRKAAQFWHAVTFNLGWNPCVLLCGSHETVIFLRGKAQILTSLYLQHLNCHIHSLTQKWMSGWMDGCIHIQSIVCQPSVQQRVNFQATLGTILEV